VSTYLYRRVVSKHLLKFTAVRKARLLEAGEPNVLIAYDVEPAPHGSWRWWVVRYSSAGNGGVR
jgi:hypothetical protein